MCKLFEIPIYALTKAELQKRYKKEENRLRREMFFVHDKFSADVAIAHLTYPQRVWEYNHIVGYIIIEYDNNSVKFTLRLPYSSINRYHWNSKKKIFLYDIHTNGTHFFINKEWNNQDIQQKIESMLESIITKHVPEKYYIDKQAYDNLKSNIDYLNVFNSLNNLKSDS